MKDFQEAVSFNLKMVWKSYALILVLLGFPLNMSFDSQHILCGIFYAELITVNNKFLILYQLLTGYLTKKVLCSLKNKCI